MTPLKWNIETKEWRKRTSFALKLASYLTISAIFSNFLRKRPILSKYSEKFQRGQRPSNGKIKYDHSKRRRRGGASRRDGWRVDVGVIAHLVCMFDADNDPTRVRLKVAATSLLDCLAMTMTREVRISNLWQSTCAASAAVPPPTAVPACAGSMGQFWRNSAHILYRHIAI